jgi:hypothetical protein
LEVVVVVVVVSAAACRKGHLSFKFQKQACKDLQGG